MSESVKTSRWGSILSGVPTTQPSNVKPLRKWDDMEGAIHKARNYQVIAQAEVHKCENALVAAKAQLEEADGLVRKATDQWRDASRTLLAVAIDEDQA